MTLLIYTLAGYWSRCGSGNSHRKRSSDCFSQPAVRSGSTLNIHAAPTQDDVVGWLGHQIRRSAVRPIAIFAGGRHA